MKKCGLLVLLCIICSLAQGCVSTPPAQPLINQAVWESVPRDKVFDCCVKALHLQGYTMQATDNTLGVIDNSRGLIGTDWISFRDGAVLAKYRFNFLVSEDTAGVVTVTVTTTGKWAADSGYTVDEESWNTHIGNKIADSLKDILSQIEQLIGAAPASTAHTTSAWK